MAEPKKNNLNEKGVPVLSPEEISELIEKARAVTDMGALGSERVYRLIKRYFSPTVVGLENIPKENTLFVGNHSGFGLDGFLLCPTLYHEAGRFVRAMGDNALLQNPKVGDKLIQSGMIPAHPEVCSAMMEDGVDLLVFPGGAHEAIKSEAQKYTLMWKERYGFVRMAAKHGYPITPFAVVGADEFYDQLIERDEFADSWLGKLMTKVGVLEEDRRADMMPFIPKGVFFTLLPKPQHCYVAFGEPITVPHYPDGKTVPQSVLDSVRDQTSASIEKLLRDMLLKRAQEKRNDGFIRRLLSR